MIDITNMRSIEDPPISIATVSPKYQVAIPKELRAAADVVPGTRFAVVLVDGGLRLIRLRPLAELKGSIPRDEAVSIRDKRDRV